MHWWIVGAFCGGYFLGMAITTWLFYMGVTRNIGVWRNGD